MNYKKIYRQLVDKGIERGWTKSSADGYTENHHIVPRSMGGSDDKDNMVRLTAREHFIAHWLLWKIHRNKSMGFAFGCMSSQNSSRRMYSRSFKYSREALSETNSKYFSGEGNPMFGRNHSEESNLKNRQAQYRIMENTKEVCPHCGEEAIFSWRDRIHFDECRKSPNCDDDMWSEFGCRISGMRAAVILEILSGNTDSNAIIAKLGCSIPTIQNASAELRGMGYHIKLTKGRFKGYNPKYNTKISSKQDDCLNLILEGERSMEVIKSKLSCGNYPIEEARRIIERTDSIKIKMNYKI
ncbi:hypothetical protein CL634_09645 [bacterium]|nr:hypothetical protein [bacterium]